MTTDFEEYSPIQNEDGREVTIARDCVGTPITCNGCRYRKMLFGNRTAELRGCDADGCFRYEIKYIENQNGQTFVVNGQR